MVPWGDISCSIWDPHIPLLQFAGTYTKHLTQAGHLTQHGAKLLSFFLSNPSSHVPT